MEHNNYIHQLAPVKVSWIKRDALLFAISIGCQVDEEHYLYVRVFFPSLLKERHWARTNFGGKPPEFPSVSNLPYRPESVQL